ncbi:efflux RND transporter periplasmic adaptor subunit [Paenibacillus oralis]|uniref:Efflux RND transporter periplasmic adaptor subunit n=1 Tax=Paenibacillus oralis TaxID=2490856 RepID=A0A3P3U3Y9_9BACL|nr:efflux RND transporter periplasmic adaptor subunit [Paenibacillus oralis]RRJ64288.1 efflux RND transporter periplasmic adaptor subunit [Paenibacillus oralis]
MRKKWIWIGSGIIVLSAIVIVLVMMLPNKQQTTQAAVQNTTKVAKGDITVSVSGSGSVVSTDSETVRTKDEGKVKEVLIKEGDVVKKGQVLLTFEAQDVEDQLKSQETSLKSQQLDLADLQDQYKRKVQEGASDEELSAAKKSITKQEWNISNTESEIAALKEDMVPPDPLTSPIDGTVTSVNITAGENAKDGGELFVINNYQNLSIKIQVDELDIPNVKLGMKSEVSIDALEGQTIEGEVTDIADEGVTSNGVSLFDVTIGLKNSENVRVGMSAEATIIIDEKTGILTLPIEAVQQRGDKYMVILPGAAADAAGGASTEQSPGAADGKASGGSAGAEARAQSGTTGQRGAAGSRSGADQSGQTSGQAAASGERGSRNQSGINGRTQEVEVGVHNESLIEIVSGLNEGDEVVVPTVVGSSSSSNQQQREQQMMPGGMGGGFSVGGPGGGMPGGGGFGGGGR